MDGCGHCVDSQEAWDKMCKTVAGAVNPECAIAEIETKHLPFFKTRDGYKPTGFPTHAFFHNGRHVEDVHDRTYPGFMKSLKKNRFLKGRKKSFGRRRRSFRR